jgi:hypothetical protein
MRNKRSLSLFAGMVILFTGSIYLQGVVVSTVTELETAMNNANNGGDKEIVLKNGTYFLNDVLAVWEDGITVRSQSGNRDDVKIYGEGMTGGITHIFNGPGSDFTVKDMTIGRVANHAIQIWGNENASNILISNLHIVDTYEQMVKISYEEGSSNRSENGIMENCLLEYTAGIGPQYYIGGIDGHQTKDWIVRNNVFKNISSPSEDIAEHAIHFWSDSEGTLVENNWIINCDRGIGFGLGDRGHVGGIIRNNMIYHSSTDHGFADVAIGLENASNAKVYNNTVYLANDYPNAIEYRFSGTSGGIIKNNLCNKAIKTRDGGSASTEANITNAQGSWFKSLSSGDLHLASEVSQVVDQGVSISGLVSDFDGDTRPQGTGIDIGADEYVTAPAPGPVPVIAVSKETFNFGAADSSVVTDSQTFSISNAGEGTLNWSISDNRGWLSCTPVSGTDSGVVSVSVDAAGLAAGTYSGQITVTAVGASNSPQKISATFTVYGSGGDAGPFGSFDTPLNGSTVQSSVPVTGWALDDVEVTGVKIYRDPVTGEGSGMVYIGDAMMVEGARTDIESEYSGYPMNGRAGWGYMMLTNFLPNGGNGTFVLYAIAEDNSGHEVVLGSRTVTCDNANAVKPFGAIDTPAPGESISGGNYRNVGWVLTPIPNTIPTTGSTITVYVDGAALGHPVYNVFRSDIASLFPGYSNSDGAAAYFYFDTTTYENGIHTIAWSATDDAGNTDGIGSRYFSIQNSATREQKSKRKRQEVLLDEKRLSGLLENMEKTNAGPVGVVKGYEHGESEQTVHPDVSGNMVITMRELERLSIRFPLVDGVPGFSSGYLWSGGRWVHLPVGSRLDSERGIFYWQPGVGYLGDYELIFIIKEETVGIRKWRITVRIVPKFETG